MGNNGGVVWLGGSFAIITKSVFETKLFSAVFIMLFILPPHPVTVTLLSSWQVSRPCFHVYFPQQKDEFLATRDYLSRRRRPPIMSRKCSNSFKKYTESELERALL